MPLEPEAIKQEAQQEMTEIDAEIESLSDERKQISSKVAEKRARKKVLDGIIRSFTPRPPRQRRRTETTEAPQADGSTVAVESPANPVDPERAMAAAEEQSVVVPASGTGIDAPAPFVPSPS